MTELQSEFDAEFAAVGSSDAKIAEARKRLFRTKVAFIIGVAIQVFAMVAGPGPRPALIAIPFIFLFGGYFIATIYLVFPPIWRMVWKKERHTLGCSPITWCAMAGSFVGILGVSFFAGPFGGGIWNYLKLQRIVRGDAPTPT
jgi:hypothetical protein